MDNKILISDAIQDTQDIMCVLILRRFGWIKGNIVPSWSIELLMLIIHWIWVTGTLHCLKLNFMSLPIDSHHVSLLNKLLIVFFDFGFHFRWIVKVGVWLRYHRMCSYSEEVWIEIGKHRAIVEDRTLSGYQSLGLRDWNLAHFKIKFHQTSS